MQEPRSDDLARLREDIVRVPSAMGIVPLPHQFWFVTDANVIRDELSFLAKKREKPTARTALQELIDSGTVIAVAPNWLREEVADHLQEWAEQLSISEDRLLQIWQDYQRKYLCFCLAPVSVVTDQPGADPDDMPYVELYNQVGARAVVSRDHHISKMGAIPVAPEVMLHLRDYARAEVVVATIKLGGYSVLAISMGSAVLTGQLTAALVRSFIRLPPWIQLALLVGTGIVALHPRSRAALAKGLHDGRMLWRAITTGLAPILTELVQTLETKSAEATAALQIVEQALPPPRRTHLESEAFAVCRVAGKPLPLKTIKERVFLRGYRSRSPNFEVYLHRVMRRSPRFVHDVNGRWSAQQ